ncbi:MAG: Acg family FMN-binding oxidoreductase [Gemmatimonadales bacterium]
MTDRWLEPYFEALGEFPISATPTQQLIAGLGWAVRAPSIHNTQPWSFRVIEDRLDAYLDDRRLLPVTDPSGREARISCGAAIEFLRIALRRFGYSAPVETVEPRWHADHRYLARVTLGQPGRPESGDRTLFGAIGRWATNRQAFLKRAVPGMALERASRRAIRQGGRLQIVTKAVDRAALVGLVADADRTQMDDPDFRRELATWLRPSASRKLDGIPAVSGKAPVLARAVAPLLVRTFDLGGAVATIDRRLAVGSPVLAILWTAGDDAAGWVGAGRALAQALLSLTADGLSVSFLNQPLEVPALRAQIRGMFHRGGDHPQMVLRIGYGPKVPLTPRRPVADVLLEAVVAG